MPTNPSPMIDASQSNAHDSDESLFEESFDETSRPSISNAQGGGSVKEELSRRESRNVFRLRVMVMMVLLLAATAVSIVVYNITVDAETEEFLSNFEGAAEQILDAFESVAKQKIGAISALAVAAIAHSIDHSRNWPFVALSSFQQRSFTARNLADALFVSIAPLVSEEEREEWENEYILSGPDAEWIKNGLDYQIETGVNEALSFEDGLNDPSAQVLKDKRIHYVSDYGEVTPLTTSGPFLPYWQSSPILPNGTLNEDLFQDKAKGDLAMLCLETKSVIIGRLETSQPGGHELDKIHRQSLIYHALLSVAAGKEVEYLGDPITAIFIPVFDAFSSNRTAIGVMVTLVQWGSFFKDILPGSTNGKLLAVLRNECYGSYTYQIEGESVTPIGPGELYDKELWGHRKTASLKKIETIVDGTRAGLPLNQHGCPYSLDVYPTPSFQASFKTNTPIFVTLAVALVFVFAVCLFLIYDRLVESRQRMILRKAQQSTAIVSSIFPKSVQDRLMAEDNRELVAANHRLKSFLTGDAKERDPNSGVSPIADLFPHCTVMFADIAGFTAWSSARDPTQVFHLLQSVYQSFDELAQRRRVFKVETIGDSYVAVAGLPEPQEKHALIMARFAHDCSLAMMKVTKELEVTLGPDTGDLSMRFGLHSGPVTAGVLRGERARFQLFGDTVNTAARMESTGVRGRIQISSETARLIEAMGKGHWTTPRADMVEAKGKGSMSTFWLELRSQQNASITTSETNTNSVVDLDENAAERQRALQKHERLIDWMVELLAEYLKKVSSKHGALRFRKEKGYELVFEPRPGKTCLDEVTDVIMLPKFDPKAAKESISTSNAVLSSTVYEQLREYVAAVAATYHENPFHNFEHACHVCMSTNKLLKRIVAPDFSHQDIQEANRGILASRLHDYTHGINSDPLTLLGILISALIHDADHRGVSNQRLCEEEQQMGEYYRGKSVAEQNSVDVSWSLLMSDQFDELRACMFCNKSEMMRFRQVMVNVVLATDIFDKELNSLRKSRWNRAFQENGPDGKDSNNIKATIVIEHIIQASDVSHTMQHWHIYRKWNERLFYEMTLAHAQGRMSVDPVSFWYQGEIGFFDNYIIPLAKKLKECGVFGVSSDEYLNYAINNRNEWKEKGQSIVSEMVQQLVTSKGQIYGHHRHTAAMHHSMVGFTGSFDGNESSLFDAKTIQSLEEDCSGEFSDR